jgi:hypothetical protein
MADIDPVKLVAAIKKLAGEVAAVKTATESLDKRLSEALNTLGAGLADILEETTQELKDENARLRADNKELRKDITYLQGLIAGHEAVIMGITGKATEVIYPEEPEVEPSQEIPLVTQEELKDCIRRREYEQARANLGD